jgi:hypothetical protein
MLHREISHRMTFTPMAESHITTLAPAEVQNVEFQDNHAQIHSPSSELSHEPLKLDIEHAVVEDDPRVWTDTRKVRVLSMCN